MIKTLARLAVVIGLLAPTAPVLAAQDAAGAPRPLRPRIPVPGIPGTLVLVGGGTVPEAAFNAFIGFARGADARLVVVSTNAAGQRTSPMAPAVARWREAGAHVSIIEARSPLDPALATALDDATGVWIDGDWFDETEPGSIAPALRAIIARGGAVSATGAAARRAGAWIASADAGAEPSPGWGLHPGCVVDRGFAQWPPQRSAAPLLARFPGVLGIGIDDGTALVIHQRRASVHGKGLLRVWSAGREGEVRHPEVFAPGRVLDLIALSRAAAARTRAPFPPSTLQPPDVGAATLFLGGGGAMPPRLARRFIAAAGGADAPIVVIPTAVGKQRRREIGRRDAAALRGWGASNVSVLDADTPEEAEDPDRLALLREAGGIWFSGGRQWRLVDAYLDTEAHALMRAIVARGGAVAGSSAGATIQAEYLVRGHPLDNRIMMAVGYERGLGFLPGVAVDQHFSQRNRFPDMTQLKLAHPQLLGIGLDEDAWAVVHGRRLEVVGPERVFIYDRDEGAVDGVKYFEELTAGDRYDLAARRRLRREE